MTKTYRGSAGKPPEKKESGKGSFNRETKGFRLFEEVQKDGEAVQKPIVAFKVDYDTKRKPVVILDHELDYSVRIHQNFKHDGTWSNMVVCRSGLDDNKGCPLCDVLERRFSWFLCATVIDVDGYTATDGKNAGTQYPFLRRLLLIPDSRAETFETIGEEIENVWRGARFNVSRSSKATNEKSPRIGETWSFDFKRGNMSDQDMLEEFEEAAERYGLSVEAFCDPMDYDTVLRVPSYEEMKEIAEAVGKTPQDEERFSSKPSKPASGRKEARPARPMTPKSKPTRYDGADDDGDDEIPF